MARRSDGKNSDFRTDSYCFEDIRQDGGGVERKSMTIWHSGAKNVKGKNIAAVHGSSMRNFRSW